MLATDVLNSRRYDCEVNQKCMYCIHCDVITPVTIKAAMRSMKKFSANRDGFNIETSLNLCASLYMLIGETQTKHRGRITNAKVQFFADFTVSPNRRQKVYIYGTDSTPDICFHTRNYTGSKFTGSKYKCEKNTENVFFYLILWSDARLAALSDMTGGQRYGWSCVRSADSSPTSSKDWCA